MCNVYSPLDDEFTELLTTVLKKAYVVKCENHGIFLQILGYIY